MVIEYRAATADDGPGIAAVLIESYNIATLDEGESAFREEQHRGMRFIVAADAKEIRGVASWVPHGLPKHGLAELDRIAVASAMRGRGLASGLVRGLRADAGAYYQGYGQRLRKLFLMTHADNSGAQAFYRKMGFEVEATLKDHFYDGRAELVMSSFPLADGSHHGR